MWRHAILAVMRLSYGAAGRVKQMVAVGAVANGNDVTIENVADRLIWLLC